VGAKIIPPPVIFTNFRKSSEIGLNYRDSGSYRSPDRARMLSPFSTGTDKTVKTIEKCVSETQD